MASPLTSPSASGPWQCVQWGPDGEDFIAAADKQDLFAAGMAHELAAIREVGDWDALREIGTGRSLILIGPERDGGKAATPSKAGRWSERSIPEAQK